MWSLKPAVIQRSCSWGYLVYGEEVLSRLNGIFAAALWDEEKETLFLFRDRVGVKPLFYTRTKDSLVYASEIKGLLRYPGDKSQSRPGGTMRNICSWTGENLWKRSVSRCQGGTSWALSDLFTWCPARTWLLEIRKLLPRRFF